MKHVVWLLMTLVWSIVVSRGQQPAAPATPTVPVQPAVPAPGQRPAPLPPGRTFDLTNTTKNPALATNNAPNPLATTNLNPTTNTLTPTGITTNQLTPTGILPSELTNQSLNASTQQVNFSITNTLSRMAPAQKAKVLQVQNGLVSLQTIATTIGRMQNVQQVVATPQIQQQVQAVSMQIGALTLGPVKPSQESTLRLSQDLLRAFGPARLMPDQLLVLAITLDHTLNSGSLTPAQLDETVNTAGSTLQGSGVPMALTHPVTCDLHSIAYELQPALAR